MVGISSVSDYGTILQNQNRVAVLKKQMDVLSGQVATGQKSTNFGGIAGDAATALAFRAQDTRFEAYNSSITRVLTKTGVMDSAMTDTTSIITNVLSQMKTITQTTDPNDAAKTQKSVANLVQTAGQALQQLAARLNTRLDGNYVFAGDQVNSQPVSDVTGLKTNAATILADLATGTSGTAILASLNGMSDTDSGLNTALATANNVSVRADDGFDVDYTVKADNDCFKDMLKGLGALTQMPFDAAHPADYWTVFNGISKMLDDSGRSLDTITGQLGQTRQQLTGIQTQHKDTQVLLTSNISSIEEVDPADAITKMNALQVQLQASYQIIAQLKGMSLVNFL